MAYTLPTISNLLKSRNQAMTDSEKRKKELLELIQQVQSLGVLGVNSGKPKSASKNGQSARRATTKSWADVFQQTLVSQKISYGSTASLSGVKYNHNGTLVSSNLSNNTMPRINYRDRIVLLSIKGCRDGQPNPIYEDTGVSGVVTAQGGSMIEVEWDGIKSSRSVYDLDYVKMEVYDQVKHDQTQKPVKVDLKLLEKLILREDAKAEIISVLKQHEHMNKIFKDWGLGEIIEYGKGMTFVFYGPPGTGKTYAANLIAKSLGKELLIISASEIQTSEPGGANRNIQHAFKSCKGGKKVLFLDECDSLITRRNDVGMILGSEINTLLTEIERFEGVCILATNRIETLDEALERRIALTVEFPNPNFAEREAIWKIMIPKKMPLGKCVDVAKLAEYQLSGGLIKNALLQAARLAASEEAKEVKMPHFEQAIARITKSKSLMGKSGSGRRARMREGDGMDSGKSVDRTVDVEKVESNDKQPELQQAKNNS